MRTIINCFTTNYFYPEVCCEQHLSNIINNKISILSNILANGLKKDKTKITKQNTAKHKKLTNCNVKH